MKSYELLKDFKDFQRDAPPGIYLIPINSSNVITAPEPELTNTPKSSGNSELASDSHSKLHADSDQHETTNIIKATWEGVIFVRTSNSPFCGGVFRLVVNMTLGMDEKVKTPTVEGTTGPTSVERSKARTGLIVPDIKVISHVQLVTNRNAEINQYCQENVQELQTNLDRITYSIGRLHQWFNAPHPEINSLEARQDAVNLSRSQIYNDSPGLINFLEFDDGVPEDLKELISRQGVLENCVVNKVQ